MFDSLSEGGGCFGEKEVELRNLPSSRATFLEGVKRAQYQFIIWKSEPDINPQADKPMPDNYGWKRDCVKYISVMTTLPPVLGDPLQLIKCGCSKSVCKTSRLTIYIVAICVEDAFKNIASEQLLLNDYFHVDSAFL